MEYTIEQYLMTLTGLIDSNKTFVLSDNDTVILTSISRQLYKGVALTDRQYELVKLKLVNYRDQFEKNEMIHLDLALENLSQPLRSIDRSQTITIEDEYIVIRFPFNKKTIAQLDTVVRKYRQFYFHEKGSNIHKFRLYEPVINEVVELFKTKKFDIESRLIEINNEIESIKSKKNEIIPYISEKGFVNVDDRVRELVLNDIGTYNDENKIKYWDRSIRYGYEKTATVFYNYNSITQHLANRQQATEYVNPSEIDLNILVESLYDLDRFPLLVTLNRNKEFTEIKKFFEIFNLVDAREQILLDRIDDRNNNNYGINSFIKEKNFNNWLDKDIKIVYIFKNSLPKLLLTGDWRPMTHISLSAEREATVLSTYIDEHCDLNIYYDSQQSYWKNLMSRQLNQWV
jgi:hypothetical protein